MLWEFRYEYLKNRNYKFLTWLVQGVFIAPEPCHVAKMKELKSHFLMIALMRDKYLLQNIKWWKNIFYTILIRVKYPLHNINDDGNMGGS
jgi:hypothetical protein